MSLRTVFMGTPEIAVPTLRALAARTTVTCVVTQPDRPAGRGHQVQPPPVKVAALELGLPVSHSVGDVTDAVAQRGAELGVVVAFACNFTSIGVPPPSGCHRLHQSYQPNPLGHNTCAGMT